MIYLQFDYCYRNYITHYVENFCPKSVKTQVTVYPELYGTMQFSSRNRKKLAEFVTNIEKLLQTLKIYIPPQPPLPIKDVQPNDIVEFKCHKEQCHYYGLVTSIKNKTHVFVEVGERFQKIVHKNDCTIFDQIGKQDY